MLDKLKYDFTCLECNYIFSNDKNISTCPKCGSKQLFKNINISLNCEINTNVSMSYKGKSSERVGKRKRPGFEFEHIETINHLGNPVAIDSRRDRKEDTYFKTVTVKKTNDKMIVRDKKLSDHKGFGSDKK